jgi:hypothetical protein
VENLFENMGMLFDPKKELENFTIRSDKQIEKVNEATFKSYSFLEPKTDFNEIEIYLN